MEIGFRGVVGVTTELTGAAAGVSASSTGPKISSTVSSSP